jgi:hypothetical protein
MVTMDTDERHHQLKHRVFELTYRELVGDAAHYAGAAQATRRAPERFFTRGAVERARAAIAQACDAADADPALAEFLTTRWLEQFAPRPV